MEFKFGYAFFSAGVVFGTLNIIALLVLRYMLKWQRREGVVRVDNTDNVFPRNKVVIEIPGANLTSDLVHLDEVLPMGRQPAKKPLERSGFYVSGPFVVADISIVWPVVKNLFVFSGSFAFWWFLTPKEYQVAALVVASAVSLPMWVLFAGMKYFHQAEHQVPNSIAEQSSNSPNNSLQARRP